MTITGRVSDVREAILKLAVRGPGEAPPMVTAVIDTGFTAHPTLPTSLIEQLELAWLRRGRAVMADGRSVTSDVREASVDWDGEPRRIAVTLAETDPLVGMALLDGHALRVEVTPAGRVPIERLP